MVAVLLACGLRRSELVGLCFEAIDLDSEKPTLEVARVVVQIDYEPVVKERPKTASSRRVLALPPAVVELLKQQRARIAADRLASRPLHRRDHDESLRAQHRGSRSVRRALRGDV